MENKISVGEFKEKVYELYKKEIDLISENSKEVKPEGNWQADTSVATEMFITYVDNHEECVFIKIPEVKSKLAELRAVIN